jgi:hypothetical protein
LSRLRIALLNGRQHILVRHDLDLLESLRDPLIDFQILHHAVVGAVKLLVSHVPATNWKNQKGKMKKKGQNKPNSEYEASGSTEKVQMRNEKTSHQRASW